MVILFDYSRTKTKEGVRRTAVPLHKDDVVAFANMVLLCIEYLVPHEPFPALEEARKEWNPAPPASLTRSLFQGLSAMWSEKRWTQERPSPEETVHDHLQYYQLLRSRQTHVQRNFKTFGVTINVRKTHPASYVAMEKLEKQWVELVDLSRLRGEPQRSRTLIFELILRLEQKKKEGIQTILHKDHCDDGIHIEWNIPISVSSAAGAETEKDKARDGIVFLMETVGVHIETEYDKGLFSNYTTRNGAPLFFCSTTRTSYFDVKLF